jgi:RNA polymerase sigma-70 factor (ECF subfamily)
VQDACAAALEQWPLRGVPENPAAWLVRVARNKAIDRIRRDVRRSDKERAAMRDLPTGDAISSSSSDDDALSLIFMCCHPALDVTVRVPLTLRSVCGLPTADIAALFLVPEPTMAKRLVRAKRKIRESGIPFELPPDGRARRLGDVLRVIYLMFTEGHRSHRGPDLVDTELCDRAIELARAIAVRLPDEPEATGLLALLLLTDARRAARTDAAGELVLLEDQDRLRLDCAQIDEGEHLLDVALAARRPGPYQIWAAIAACHSTAPTGADTDWRQIAGLYHELLRYEPTAVVEANRAIAVAMAEGPTAGLVILETLQAHPHLGHWAPLHLARADLYRRLGDTSAARAAYHQALQLEPPRAERAFVHRRLTELAD